MSLSLDNALWLASFLAEAAVVGLLVYRHVWRTLPVFTLYCAWFLLVDAAAVLVMRSFPNSYFRFYLTVTVVYSVLEFAVLVELAWSVLRPLRNSLPRSTVLIIGAFILGLGAAIWPFATIPGFGDLPPEWHLLMHLQQDTSLLRILIFLLLAGCSQLLSISWRDRELQVATGLGFYSLVGLAVAVIHTHQTKNSQYMHLDQLEVASYIGSLLYWAVSIAQKEAERREFTPQMQNLLLAMAGTAKSTRITLVSSAAAKSRKPGE
jgi:hypothetical protein